MTFPSKCSAKTEMSARITTREESIQICARQRLAEDAERRLEDKEFVKVRSFALLSKGEIDKAALSQER
jgi:hypothetical protein